MDLSGKTILITGAAGNIGAACAEAFRAAGAQVALTDLRGDGDILACDATDTAAVEAAFAAFLDRFGKIDAAVLATGTEGAVAPIEEITDADLDQAFAINVKATLAWMRPCLRHMKANRSGSIVALCSISGVVGAAQLGAYTLTKHAVMGLVRAAALESGPFNVRVNAVCPGPIESDMMRRLDAALTARDPARAAGKPDASKSLPLQRYVTTAEVAAMAGFLCSDASSSCHGGAFMVDGGFTAR